MLKANTEEETVDNDAIEPDSWYGKVGNVDARLYRSASAFLVSIGLAYMVMSTLSLGSGIKVFAMDMDVTGSALSKAELKSMFDPSNFSPVCPTSDSIYNILKSSANIIVGPENVMEYGPLIASVLLRIRLELCVLESFVYEGYYTFHSSKKAFLGSFRYMRL